MEIYGLVLKSFNCEINLSIEDEGILKRNNLSFSQMNISILSFGSQVLCYACRGSETFLSGFVEVAPGTSWEIEISLVLTGLIRENTELKTVSKHDVVLLVVIGLDIIWVFKEQRLVKG